MFGRKKDYREEPVDLPFDEDSYQPEPSDHFGNSVNDMTKLIGLGGLAFAILYGGVRLLQSGAFN